MDVKTVNIIRMIQCKDSDNYRRLHKGEFIRRARDIELEGVDGDEETNTVTYWYTRKEEV